MCLLRYRYLNNWQSNVPSLPDSLRLMDLQIHQSTYILHPLKYPFFHFRCTYEPPSSWTVCVSGGEAGWTWSVWTGWVVWSLTRIVPSVRTPSLRSRYVRTHVSCRVVTRSEQTKTVNLIFIDIQTDRIIDKNLFFYFLGWIV